MAYESLYRKYRPRFFRELVGQEHVADALRHAVREDRVGHAYLFSGPRGTGKTTTARLLAKALNCLDLRDDGEPCGACTNCTDFDTTPIRFPDLVELDAASQNGVEHVRELIERVHLGLGATAKRKVYILDEVHMLSTAASNALLKTLEEPPPHVCFVLATTDPGKVLPTIRSRTQHFEFTLLPDDLLRAHLESVLAREGIDADRGALDAVLRRAAGSARDALSFLDRAIASSDGRLDADEITAALGAGSFDACLAILDAAAQEDPAGALVGVADALAGGLAPRDLAESLLDRLREAFLLQAARDRVPVGDTTEEQRVRLGELAEAMGAAALVRGIETLGQAIVDLRGAFAPDPRLVVEVAVVRMARRETGPAAEVLLERIQRLEREVAELRSGGGGAVGAAGGGAPGGAVGVAAGAARGGPGGSGDDAVVPPPPRPAAAPAPAPAPAPAVAPDARVDAPAGRSGPGTALGAHRRAGARGPGPAGPDAVAAPAAPSADPTPAGASAASEPTGAGAPGAGAAQFELDDVVLAWPRALEGLSAPLKALVAHAQPVAVEGDVVVFAVPPGQLTRTRTKFRDEAERIKQALTPLLGETPRFKLVAQDDFQPPRAGGPGAAGGDPGADREPPADTDAYDPYEVDDVALDELVDAPPGEAAVDSVTRLQQQFGAEIVGVEERRS